MHLPKLLIICLALVAFSSCERDSVPANGGIAGNDKAARKNVCSAFNYADSIFYLRNQVADYVVSPVTALAGTYGATPWGLSINPATGAINVSKSETGLTYKVFFVQAGSADTCTRFITISGIDFASSVHFLSKNDISVKPTYKGNKFNLMSSNTGSLFDVAGVVNSQLFQSLGISIDQLSAAINLKQTVSNGLFGSTPVNGASRTVRLYYAIDDASKKALNHIDLRFTYFNTQNDIPDTMLSKVGLTNKNARVAATTSAESAESTGARPPEIVIVGH